MMLATKLGQRHPAIRRQGETDSPLIAIKRDDVGQELALHDSPEPEVPVQGCSIVRTMRNLASPERILA
jgi:hypothetical protein